MTRAALPGVVFLLGLFVWSVAPAAAQHQDHSHGEEERSTPERTPLPPFIPPVTDEDRRAAFPDVEGHAVHDSSINHFVLVDQLEWQSNAGGTGMNVDTKGWIGGDRDRVWFRAEGNGVDGRVGDAQAHLLYGRLFSRWWDVVVGLRQDVRPDPSRTWLAIGVQGLAPYWFEVEATAYIGAAGRTHFRGELEYELLLTNRLVLQPLVEIEVFGKSDPERSIGSGFSMAEAGVRLRYEIRRELAPYVGVTFVSKLGRTRDFAEAAGEDAGGVAVVAGARLWF